MSLTRANRDRLVVCQPEVALAYLERDRPPETRVLDWRDDPIEGAPPRYDPDEADDL